MPLCPADQLRNGVRLAFHDGGNVFERIPLPIGKLDHAPLAIRQLTQRCGKALILNGVYKVGDEHHLQRVTALYQAAFHVNKFLTHAFQ